MLGFERYVLRSASVFKPQLPVAVKVKGTDIELLLKESGLIE
mgnify:FL=1